MIKFGHVLNIGRVRNCRIPPPVVPGMRAYRFTQCHARARARKHAAINTTRQLLQHSITRRRQTSTKLYSIRMASFVEVTPPSPTLSLSRPLLSSLFTSLLSPRVQTLTEGVLRLAARVRGGIVCSAVRECSLQPQRDVLVLYETDLDPGMFLLFRID